ncbi:flagellar motor protein MotB [Jonesia quinghaiensis]|uniref:flagellar motor protein MotB n=1 Tax=Jonesia quinghaiensis TaxID=262806 RepID=UPI00040AF66C|nr:flagellar motor protein MotB [Jonesia quinghaiensis]
MSRPKHPKKRGGAHEEEHADSERWLVSYADMLTVLVGLFIVMYAMSQVDESKYEQLAASLAVSFGGSGGTSILSDGSSILETNSSVIPTTVVPPEGELATALRNDGSSDNEGDSDEEAINPKDMAAARAEFENLESLAERIDKALKKRGLEGSVEYRINERGLIVGLVSDELFFLPDTATLTSNTRKVVDTTAPIMRELNNELSIEGHANSLRSVNYKSNWELSSDRATQVLRRYVEKGKISGDRIAAVGFGDTRPLAKNNTKRGLTVNRRVDIVILSSEPERVRDLLTLVATETDTGETNAD